MAEFTRELLLQLADPTVTDTGLANLIQQSATEPETIVTEVRRRSAEAARNPNLSAAGRAREVARLWEAAGKALRALEGGEVARLRDAIGTDAEHIFTGGTVPAPGDSAREIRDRLLAMSPEEREAKVLDAARAGDAALMAAVKAAPAAFSIVGPDTLREAFGDFTKAAEPDIWTRYEERQAASNAITYNLAVALKAVGAATSEAEATEAELQATAAA